MISDGPFRASLTTTQHYPYLYLCPDLNALCFGPLLSRVFANLIMDGGDMRISGVCRGISQQTCETEGAAGDMAVDRWEADTID